MNADEFNKIAACVIGSLLAFILLGFFSAKIFGTGAGSHHGEEPLAFALEIEDDSGDTDDAPQIDLAALAVNADAAAGEKVFAKCKACHKIQDGENGVGPSLWGVVGRKIASVDGFDYSQALAGMDGDWNLETLDGFLENPKVWAQGTKMSFAGLKDAEDRVNLIAWLNEEDGSPIVLAEAPADAPAETATDATAEEPSEAPAAEGSTEGGETASQDAAETPEGATEGAAEAATEDAPETTAEETEQTAEAATDAAEDTAAAAGAAATGGAYADLLANADAAAGKKIFRKCRACHKLEEGKNGVGPSLWGVVDRPVASIEGYSYSDALAGKGGEWTLDHLMPWLEAPRSYIKGTKMAFGGIKDAQDRINLITYLNEADGSPEPLE